MGMPPGGNAHRKAEINVTPMIDVLLVLIIIFMVITPLTPRGLNALVPQEQPSDRKQLTPTSDIVITVRGNGTVRLNQEPIEMAHLQERLTLLFKSSANNVIFVRGEADLEFGQIAEVIDIAKGAGLNRVALMTRMITDRADWHER
jgi:biopolymer transport protein ExbD